MTVVNSHNISFSTHIIFIFNQIKEINLYLISTISLFYFICFSNKKKKKTFVSYLPNTYNGILKSFPLFQPFSST